MQAALPSGGYAILFPRQPDWVYWLAVMGSMERAIADAHGAPVRLQRKLNVAQVIDLPEELAATAGPACIIWNVNAWTAFVVKLDQQTIDGFRGALPIGLRAECGFYPDSAVIRLVLSFHDQPKSPYVFDVFLNVMQPMHLSLLRMLQDQATIEIHFLNADNHHALTKSISYPARNRHELSALVNQAIEHNCRLSRLDFAAAGGESGHVA